MTRSEYQELVEFLGAKFDVIDRRFEAIDQRFDVIDRRFEAIDQRFEAMDRRFDAIDRRFDAMDRRFDAMDRRFDAIDRRFDAMEERLTRVEVLAEEDRHQIQIVAEAVVGLRETMTVEFKAVRSEMAAGFDVQGRLIRSLGNRVARLEA